MISNFVDKNSNNIKTSFLISQNQFTVYVGFSYNANANTRFYVFEASIITHLRILLIYYLQAEHLLLKCYCLYFVFNINCLFVYRIIPKLVLCYQFTFVTNIILLFVAFWPKKCFQHILDWKSLLVITLFDTFNWSQFCIC